MHSSVDNERLPLLFLGAMSDDTISVGSVVGIMLGIMGAFVLCCACVFLRSVWVYRQRVRRAVDEARRASRSSAQDGDTTRGTSRRRSRYPEALPCDDYDALYGEEEPARGNAVFQSRANLKAVVDVLVRVEEAGVDRSSADYSTTELVSLNASMSAAASLPPAASSAATSSGVAGEGGMKGTQRRVPSALYGIGSLDNEHNVAVTVVSTFPTPASSMPSGYGLRQRGASQSLSLHVPDAPSALIHAPPTAKPDGPRSLNHGAFSTAAPAQAVGTTPVEPPRGGMRLLVPLQEHGCLSSDTSAGRLHDSSTHTSTRTTPAPSFALSNPDARRSAPAGLSACAAGMVANAPAHVSLTPSAPSAQAPLLLSKERVEPPLLQRPAVSASVPDAPVPDHAGGWQTHVPYAPRRFSSHGTETTNEPPAQYGAHGGTFGVTTRGTPGSASLPPPLAPHQREQPLSLSRVAPLKKRKLRIHRQYRVRNVDRGGYVVLEELEESTSRSDNSEAEAESSAEHDGRESTADSQHARSSDAPVLLDAHTEAEAERKRRYYFEKLSSLDVYGRGQYMPRTDAGLHVPAGGSSGDEAEENGACAQSERAVGTGMLSGTRLRQEAPSYTPAQTHQGEWN